MRAAQAHENLLTFSALMAELGRGTAVRTAEALAFEVPGGPAMLRGVLPLELDGDPAAAMAAGAERFAGQPWSCCTPHSGSSPGVREAARRAGLTDTGQGPAMWFARPPEEQDAPAGIHVRTELDDRGWQDFWRVCAEAYRDTDYASDLPSLFAPPYPPGLAARLHPVVAYDGEQPLGTALTIEDDGVAGLYWVGVLPSARGRGTGTLCSGVALRDAFARGATAAVLQSSPSGLGIYRRLGGVPLFSYDYWVHRPSGAARP